MQVPERWRHLDLAPQWKPRVRPGLLPRCDEAASILAMLAVLPLLPPPTLQRLYRRRYTPATMGLYLDRLHHAGLVNRLKLDREDWPERRPGERWPVALYLSERGLTAVRDLFQGQLLERFPALPPGALTPEGYLAALTWLAGEGRPHHLALCRVLAALTADTTVEVDLDTLHPRVERWVMTVAGFWRGGVVPRLLGLTRRSPDRYQPPYADLLVLLAFQRFSVEGGAPRPLEPVGFRLACLEVERGHHTQRRLRAKGRRYGRTLALARLKGVAPDLPPLLLLVLAGEERQVTLQAARHAAHALVEGSRAGGAELPVLATTLAELTGRPGQALEAVWVTANRPELWPHGAEDERTIGGGPVPLVSLGPEDFTRQGVLGTDRLPAPFLKPFPDAPEAYALAHRGWAVEWYGDRWMVLPGWYEQHLPPPREGHRGATSAGGGIS